MALTTTSYAILGHLALRSWTTYELAEQFRKNLRYYFPRAESRLYAEPKRLVRLGLASSRRERVGKRSRTVYAITAKGRAALGAWLASPSAARGPSLEFEAVLRVMLAPLGDDAALLEVLRGVRDEIGVMLAMAEEIRAQYDRGEAPFQRFVVHRSLMHDFLCSFAQLVDDWAARSIARVERWPAMSAAQREREALDVYRALPRRRRPKSGPGAPARGLTAGVSAQPTTARRTRSPSRDPD